MLDISIVNTTIELQSFLMDKIPRLHISHFQPYFGDGRIVFQLFSYCNLHSAIVLVMFQHVAFVKHSSADVDIF